MKDVINLTHVGACASDGKQSVAGRVRRYGPAPEWMGENAARESLGPEGEKRLEEGLGIKRSKGRASVGDRTTTERLDSRERPTSN